MRKVIFMLTTLVIFGLSAQAQKKNKNAKITFKANGVCTMCKKRIEKAALKSKGVKFASWNVKTKDFFAIIDERKTDKKTVQQTIANSGHDTKDIKAPNEKYEKLHFCCKYRDDKVINSHKKQKNK